MRRWILAGLSLLALGAILPNASADIAGGRRGFPPVVPPNGNPFVPPGGRIPPVKVRLVVKVKENAKLPVLQVPINLALGQQPAGAGRGDVPPGGADAGRRLGMPTIVAGLALTLAFASGGLWLARRGSGRSLAIVAVLSLFTVGTAAVWANADLFPRPQPRPARPVKAGLPELKLPAGIELKDKLILEPVLTGDHLTLIVPKSMVQDKEKKEKEATPREKRGR